MASKPIASHHAEWLKLVEASGPFLSLEVLTSAFPQGLPKADQQSALRQRLSSAYDEWLDNQGGLNPEAAIHRAWLDFVLREVFDWDEEVFCEGQGLPATLRVAVPEHGVTLAPTLAAINPEGTTHAGKPRVLVMHEKFRQDLDKAVAGDRWKASPATRMATLLHATDVRLGLVTNGEHWMLVHAAPGETTTYASFYASLFVSDEPLILRALTSLLDTNALWAREDGDTTEALFERSKDNQQEVTDQLGSQVRRAVETLIQCIDRIDRDRGRQLLRGIPETQLYEAAVTVMMRLVFLLCAEERGLLLLGDPLYDQHYAISTLRDQLQEQADRHGPDVLERRHDAFARLLATFRAVHGGVRHDHFQLPAYGGSLFDPDRFPYLEGRAQQTGYRDTPASPLPIDNLTVLDLLNSLTLHELKVKGKHAESRRVSFRALDVEQIGHVYEGLLDHTAKRAQGTVLGLAGSKDKEPEVSVTELNERLEREGEDGLVKWLSDKTGRSTSALTKRVQYEIPKNDRNRWLLSVENNPRLFEQVSRYAGFVREDTHRRPVVFGDGAIYVTAGTDRRSTGTHYTPRSLTEPIVRHTLEPLVYEGPAEGLPKDQWKLKPASALLKLKICDMAMGSGAFLVQVCRYLSERLVEAWEEAERQAGGALVLTPEGELTRGDPRERVVPPDTDERLAIARRVVSDRCVYGVDRNPLAVEMAKLSLWLVTLQRNKPFTFVDHALRCGDSLLGLTNVEQIQHFHIDPSRVQSADGPLFRWAAGLHVALDRANELRTRLNNFTIDTLEDAKAKERLLQQANGALGDVRLIADLVIGSVLATAGRGDTATDVQLADLLPFVSDVLARAEDQYGGDFNAKRAALKKKATDLINANVAGSAPQLRPFHWAVEFPEVMASGGFHALVGNPPFKGGSHLMSMFGEEYRDLLVRYIAGGRKGRRGQADLSVYFLLRAAMLTRPRGTFCLICNNTAIEGDSLEIGLGHLISQTDCTPYRAVPSNPWPGTAQLEVVLVWLFVGAWGGRFYRNEKEVSAISARLEASDQEQEPFILPDNKGMSGTGVKIYGQGFLLSSDEAERWLSDDPACATVLQPYVNGEELNALWNEKPDRWVINFRDWPLSHDETSRPGPAAVDFPRCLQRVRDTVYPQRQAIEGDYGTARYRRTYWWRFSNDAERLYRRLREFQRVPARARISSTHGFLMVPVSWACNEKTVLVATHLFSVLQSSIHDAWACKYASTLRSDLQYSTTRCLDTFPFPPLEEELVEGQVYETRRTEIMKSRQEGLTDIYRRFHDERETAGDILELRQLQVQLDEAVARAYGWTGLSLDHGFHDTKLGQRFTIGECARLECLDRLLALNHTSHEEQNCVSKQDAPVLPAEPRKNRGRTAPRRRRSKSTSQSDLHFGDEDEI